MNGIAFKIKTLLGELFTNKQALIKILSIIVILALAFIFKIHNSGQNDIRVDMTNDTTATESTSDDKLCVDIGGAVEKPGVYQVDEGTRLFEVIELAGGLRSDADTYSVNQAAYVEDGSKVVIPQIIDNNEDAIDSNLEIITPSSEKGLININTADIEELKKLSGIGDVMASRIIEYRSVNRFSKKEDIMSVNGIGSAIFEKIKDQIVV